LAAKPNFSASVVRKEIKFKKRKEDKRGGDDRDKQESKHSRIFHSYVGVRSEEELESAASFVLESSVEVSPKRGTIDVDNWQAKIELCCGFRGYWITPRLIWVRKSKRNQKQSKRRNRGTSGRSQAGGRCLPSKNQPALVK